MPDQTSQAAPFGWSYYNASMLDLVSRDKAKRPENEQMILRYDSLSSQWRGGLTLKTAIQDLYNPSASLLESIERQRELVASAFPPAQIVRKLRRRLDCGDMLDPYSVLRRETDTAWSARKREAIPRQIVRIGINISRSHDQSGDSLLWSGSTACALADTLTSQGASVEIVAIFACKAVDGARRDACLSIVASEANQPLDISRIASIAANIYIMRMVVMPYRTSVLDFAQADGGGKPCEPPDEVLAELDYYIPRGVVSEATAATWFAETMAKKQVA